MGIWIFEGHKFTEFIIIKRQKQLKLMWIFINFNYHNWPMDDNCPTIDDFVSVTSAYKNNILQENDKIEENKFWQLIFTVLIFYFESIILFSVLYGKCWHKNWVTENFSLIFWHYYLDLEHGLESMGFMCNYHCWLIMHQKDGHFRHIWWCWCKLQIWDHFYIPSMSSEFYL